MDAKLIVGLTFILDWVIRIGFILYVPRKRKPSSAIAWLLFILLVPGIGVLLFIIIGSPKLSKGRRAKQAEVDRLIQKFNHDMDNQLSDLSAIERSRIEPITDLARSLGKMRAVKGNSFKVLPDYDKAITDIVKELKKAEVEINLEYFILALDKTTQPIFDALAAAVKRGVRVRVLFDGMGYRAYPRRREMKKLLTEIGAEWHVMLPPTLNLRRYNRIDLRNHRKILVIDKNVAYIGSQNLIDRTYHRKDDIYYDELIVKMNGPVVLQCDVVFASDWYAETNEKLDIAQVKTQKQLFQRIDRSGNQLAQIVPSGSAYDTFNTSKLFTALIHAARKKIVITNPYFVPDDAIMDAVTSASLRGVEVTIINSEPMDQWMVGHAQRSYYKELLEYGVNIYLHKAPVLLHSKHITIDDDIAVIGSSNMDIRSFELNLECVVVVYSKKIVKDLQKVQVRDISNSKKVNSKTWNQRSYFAELLDSIARLTSALQ